MEFKSQSDYWNFERSTTREARYVRPPEMEAFLETLLFTARSRFETVRSGHPFWRAQIGCQRGAPIYVEDAIVGYCNDPLPPEKMKPLERLPSGELLPEGRANPKGTPYLYLATHRKTAMAEMRPWGSQVISVAQLKTRRDLTVVNLTNDDRPTRMYVGAEPPPDQREKWVWSEINSAFGRPVAKADESVAYIPTQIIAELFRIRGGVDGLAYRSWLGDGHNVVLFDLDAAELITRDVYRVVSITHKFEPAISG